MRCKFAVSALFAVSLFVSGIVVAEEPTEPPATPEAASSVTQHQVSIGGEVVSYSATAGYLIVTDANEQPAAKFGYTAYVRDGVDDPAKRPVMFAYNGGPGSSSIWLHMGILGPRRVVTPDPDFAPPPPYELVDNEHSIIDVVDLVMVDPVGTGYSRPIGEAKGGDFWGVDQDIDSVSRFIKAWITENGRWASPKFILGESYGGMRSGGVALELLGHGMALNGVIVVSPFMSWDSGFDFAGIDLPHVMFLPTFAATAWYHEAIEDRPPSVAEFTEEVRQFAYDEYAPALLKGSRLGDAERSAVAAKLARYTGLDAEYWEAADLRVNHMQFVQELLRDRGQAVGRVDSRYVGRVFNRLGEMMEYDPHGSAISPAYIASFLDYYHRELEFGQDLEYTVSGGQFAQWDWSHSPPGLGGFGIELPHPNTALDLARAMGESPHMKLLVQQGYYDLATPQLATEYAIEHMDLTPEQRENVTIEYYEAGHMMYQHEPSAVKFKADLARFVEKAVSGR